MDEKSVLGARVERSRGNNDFLYLGDDEEVVSKEFEAV